MVSAENDFIYLFIYFVLEEECLKEPTKSMDKSKRIMDDKWMIFDKIVRYYILVSMSNMFSKKVKSQDTFYDILEKPSRRVLTSSKRACFEAILPYSTSA